MRPPPLNHACSLKGSVISTTQIFWKLEAKSFNVGHTNHDFI